MARKIKTIQLGDRFAKVGTYKSVWTVTRILEFPDLPTHLHITPETADHRVLTFSTSALLDEALFTRMPALAENDDAEAGAEVGHLAAGAKRTSGGSSFLRNLFLGHAPRRAGAS